MIVEKNFDNYKQIKHVVNTFTSMIMDSIDADVDAPDTAAGVTTYLPNMIIAGGCFKDIFTGKKTKDVDVFFKNNVYYNELITMIEMCSKVELKYENNRVRAYKYNNYVFEFIHPDVLSGSATHIINTFDFTITKFAVSFETDPNLSPDAISTVNSLLKKVVCHSNFFEHLHLHKLVIDQDTLPNPYNTFFRSIKYARYGYSLCAESQMKLIRLVKESNLAIDGRLDMYVGID